ncbi:MAG: hypothetical protein Q9207_001579 [Kuettlingeria erythrocarpa]
MAPSKRAPSSSSTSTPSKPSSQSQSHSQPSSSAHQPTPKPSSASSRTSTTLSSISSSNDPRAIAASLWKTYLDKTPQRVKLIDVFMGFLVVVGGLQFLYCVLVGNYPFNAFLSGFSATVGQFVLTASLRIQTNPENKEEFRSVSHERYVLPYLPLCGGGLFCNMGKG